MMMALKKLWEGFQSKRAPVVSVLRLEGMIGGGGRCQRGLSLDAISRDIDAAFASNRVRAVALVINSPGGAPVQAELIRRRLVDLSTEKDIPLVAFCEDVAASGGYWLACAAPKIYAQEASIIGSIGVISAGFGAPALLAKIGLERRVYSAGDQKSMLDPFQTEKPEDVTHLKALQAEIHEGFKKLVRDSRADRLTAPEDELFNGAFWTGSQARDLGLIDDIGELRQVMRQTYGDNVKFRSRRRRRGLMGRFGMASDAAAGTLIGDCIEAGLEALEARALWARFGR